MGKAIAKRSVGRPTKLDDNVVAKLDSIFKVGGNVEEACSYALINKTTYYRWLEENEDFATKMESAQHYADIVAKNVVVDSMIKDRDLNTAKWWLEKREFKANNQTNIQVNNFVPLLDGESVRNVPTHNSDQQDTQSDQES